MAKAENLVIVESPAKAKTIGKYLGPNYVVKACMGHLRDLPKSKMGVDIDADFTPQYMPLKGKEAVIAELREAAANSSCVYLATDPDREGEAISWHLKYLLDLPEESTHRVTFNEITKNVVNTSIQHPREIDQDLVDAQQARRILDRIVGYQLSPLLWKKIRRGLSAGRVQSVATRMVVDREEEIRAFQPQEYWSIDVSLERMTGPGKFMAHYHGEGKKRELHSEEEVNEILRDVENAPFVVSAVKRSEKKKTPAPPFITSTLQQEASRKLGMTPKRTMAIAQQLYEGIDVAGEGTVGLITYMRTDSLRLSEEALAAAGSFIGNRYGADFYKEGPRRYKTKNAAQDAHEAIRPSNVQLDPESIRGSLTTDQYKLYRLVWSRFVASQMSNAIYDTLSIDTVSAGHIFRANHQSLKFPGFIAVYEEGKDDETEEKDTPLPNLQEGETVLLGGHEKQQHFTQPPARYTEATLVKAMEEKGVGRPSTYATTVSTILDREYVIKTDKRLSPTPLGEVVTGLMKERFTDVIDVAFTAHMEERLDQVETGDVYWKQVLRDFYQIFHQEMEDAEVALEGVRLKVPDEVTEEICELCGRNMVIKSGRFGRFLACPGYPECKNTKPLAEHMPGRCPKCGSGMLKRKSQRGYAYYACEKGKDCGFMSWEVPTAEDCPYCGKTLFKKSGKGQKKMFCINPECENFTPEELRGYRKKKTEEAQSEQTEAAEAKETVAAEAVPEKKTRKTTKKAAEKSSEKKTAAKKTTKKAAAEDKPAKKTTKKTAEKKTAAKKTTAKKATAKKTTTAKKTKKQPEAEEA
jgi:DNA topoisomerase-1